MKFTNKLNLPDSFVNYVKGEQGGVHVVEHNKFSVTELIGSPREIVLKRKFDDVITKDISDMIPALFGTAVHSILEKNAPDTVSSEVKITGTINNCIIVGRIDCLDVANKKIIDYKTGSTSKVMKEDFDDFKVQGLMYAWILYNFYDTEIRHLEFPVLMKDWSKVKSSVSSTYPVSPVYVWKMDIQDSDFIFIEKWMKEKLNSILNYNNEPCTDEEKWYTGTKYAVYKNGFNDKAKYVADSLEGASNYLVNKLGFENGHIVERKGNCLKCELYCDVRDICEKLAKGE